jgi:hypothetical protein
MNEEIKDLVARWAFYADSKEAHKQVELFADDFENITIMPDGETANFTDKDSLEEGIRQALSAFPQTFHMNGQILIDGLTATSYCIAHHFRADGTILVMYIRYEDDFVETGEGLKFKKRVLHILRTEER